MKARKYTLPRHTILAKQGSRIGAFLADLAMVATLFVLLFLCCSKFIFVKITGPLQEQEGKQEYNAGLVIRNEDKYEKITTEDSQVYVNALKYHFLCYMNGENIDEDKEAFVNAEAGKYTVEWFNKTILEIPENPDSDSKSLFTYDGGDKTKVGVIKPTADEVSVRNFIQEKYIDTFSSFLDLDFMSKIENKLALIFTSEFVLSIFVSGVIFYVIIPLATVNGRTLGKMMFGLALANKEGYEIESWQIAMRFIPFGLTCFIAYIPFFDILGIMLTALTIFLSSFAFAMASPKRMSLHDFTAGTIVIDNNESKIFKNSEEEDKFILKEDNISDEEESNE